jgi:hypothetical protein
MVAATAKYYGWSPSETKALTLSEIRRWHEWAMELEKRNG